jgi:flavin reductase (DIM6/NTAB) family NADH-FMN oxidoreductase RutF
MKRELPLKLAHRLLAVRPTCLLTARYKGQVNVMTMTWVCPVSLEPPLVIMAIHPASYTHDMLKRSQECVLSIPGRALAEQSWKCGNVSGEDEDKIKLTKLNLESGQRVGVPSIAECLAYLECAVIDVLKPGDHTLFIAEILGAWAEEEAFDTIWRAPAENEELHPLLHLGGKSFCLLGKTIILP